MNYTKVMFYRSTQSIRNKMFFATKLQSFSKKSTLAMVSKIVIK